VGDTIQTDIDPLITNYAIPTINSTFLSKLETQH